MSNYNRGVRAVLAALLVFHCASVLGDTLPAPVAQTLARAGIPAAAVALWVQPVDDSKPVVAHNAAQPMNPASVMKLVTTFAALELLGPTFTWKTEAYLGGALTGDSLDSDLILKGYGDPKLTIENLWLFLQGLRARGLREIRGDLVLDRSYFDPEPADSGRFDGEPLRAYNVVPDALLVNFKAVRFLFVPDAEDKSVKILQEPHLPQIGVINTVRATEGSCGDWRGAIRRDIQMSGTQARIAFAGLMPASCGERYWAVALLSHPQYVYGVFRQLWEQLGGTLRGGVRDGLAPLGAKPFATFESPALAEVVRDINKFSNNVMARQLFLTLSAEALKLPGRNDRSARAIQAWLQGRGTDIPELVLENGSGLSRHERISAASLGKLLLAAYRSPVMPEFVASLPLVAYDGTMRRRLQSASVAGSAHIKTGSLNEVSTMAGYVLDRNGRRLALVFLINHPRAGAAQAAQDALLRWTYEGAQ